MNGGVDVEREMEVCSERPRQACSREGFYPTVVGETCRTVSRE